MGFRNKTDFLLLMGGRFFIFRKRIALLSPGVVLLPLNPNSSNHLLFLTVPVNLFLYPES